MPCTPNSFCSLATSTLPSLLQFGHREAAVPLLVFLLQMRSSLYAEFHVYAQFGIHIDDQRDRVVDNNFEEVGALSR